MPKNSVNDWDATAANNTDVGGISIAEGMLPSNVNNAMREMMKQWADVVAGTTALSSVNIDGGSISGISPGVTIEGSSSGDALRITQTGSGNALVVEDSSNPDSTPTLIDASGDVIIGHTTQQTGAGGVSTRVQVLGNTGATGSQNFVYSATGTAASVREFLKSSSGSIGTNSAVVSGETLGVLRWSGADGTNFIRSAEISAFVDGTPGTSDMPGRLVFSTTADGASSPTERMRITSDGSVGISTSSPDGKLDIATGGTTDVVAALGGTFPAFTYRNGTGSWFHAGKHPSSDYFYIGRGATPTTNVDFVVDTSGNVGIGVSPGAAKLQVSNSAATHTVLYLQQTNTSYNTDILLYNANNTTSSTIVSKRTSGDLWLYQSGANNVAVYTDGTARLLIGSTGIVRPGADNTQTLGSASYRWSVVYAGTGTINTSDEREKQQIANLDDAERRVAVAIKGLVKKYKYNDAVTLKGDDARIHVGVIAQEVIAAFAAEGLDATRYALLCHDTWEAEPEETDDEGNVINPGIEAGERYGIRYDELLAFMIAAL